MSKGSWRRPTGPDFDSNYCKTFPTARGCRPSTREELAQDASNLADEQKEARRVRSAQVTQRSRFVALTLDELRTLVFETSVAYASHKCGRKASEQEAEWSRAAALKAGLERLGFARESEMIGGAA